MCICVIMAFATQHLEVSAKNIESDLKKGESILDGDVFVKRGEDKLWADKVFIESDKKLQPIKYTAIGNVRFYAKTQDKEMQGKANKAIYDVKKGEYQLLDNAMLEEIGKKNTIRGNIITFNPHSQEAQVAGSNQKPSVVTFIMDDAKSEQ